MSNERLESYKRFAEQHEDKELLEIIQQAERAEKNAQDLEDMDRQLAYEQKRARELELNVELFREGNNKTLLRYNKFRESVFSIIQIVHLGENSSEEALKQIENLVIDLWESEGEV